MKDEFAKRGFSEPKFEKQGISGREASNELKAIVEFSVKQGVISELSSEKLVALSNKAQEGRTLHNANVIESNWQQSW